MFIWINFDFYRNSEKNITILLEIYDGNWRIWIKFIILRRSKVNLNSNKRDIPIWNQEKFNNYKRVIMWIRICCCWIICKSAESNFLNNYFLQSEIRYIKKWNGMFSLLENNWIRKFLRKMKYSEVKITIIQNFKSFQFIWKLLIRSQCFPMVLHILCNPIYANFNDSHYVN